MQNLVAVLRPADWSGIDISQKQMPQRKLILSSNWVYFPKNLVLSDDNDLKKKKDNTRFVALTLSSRIILNLEQNTVWNSNM